MLYKYKARTHGGAISTGTREAASEDAALNWIREQGMSPIYIEGESLISEAVSGQGSILKKLNSIELTPQRVTLKDKSVLFRQMATMIDSGITIAGAIDLLASQSENKSLKKALTAMRESVGSGVTLAGSMARHPSVFSTLDISLVRAGEEGGVLDVSLERLAVFVESQYALQKKVKAAMAYPMVVISFTLIVIVILCLFIVPLFRKAFMGMGIAKLPALTEFIFGISDLMVAYWWAMPIPFVAIYVALKMTRKTEPGARFLDKGRIKAPITGDIVYKIIMARSFRTLATLVTAGVSILDALEMSADVSDNRVVRDAFMIIKEKAQNGVALNMTMRDQKLFPLMVAHMVSVGEETGRIDEVLMKVADWYDMELEEKIKSLTTIIEPVLIVVVGLIVGLVVASVFVPIMQAMQQFM